MKIQTPKGVVSSSEGNIIKILLNDDIHLQASDMPELQEAMIKLAAGNAHVVLLMSGDGSTISKEALHMMHTKAWSQQLIAMALVVNLLAQNYITKLFEKDNTTGIPIAVFSTRSKALNWLTLLNQNHLN